MAYKSLYRKYRPVTFEEMIGQNHITRTLKNQIKSGNISHAYLFTGARGTGKTTAAKIFARAVNCLENSSGSPCNKCENCLKLSIDANLDIIEIDAASNNGVNEIREIIENSKYPPTVGKYKVYIIDEVHMLSLSAFNALLKTLEEPPEHVIFILATTEVHKLPETIISRCLKFDFRLVPEPLLEKQVKAIFDKMKINYDTEAVKLIASFGEGSVRDTLSIADMCLSYAGGNTLSYDDVTEVLGVTRFDNLYEITKYLLAGDIKNLLKKSDEVLNNGADVLQLSNQIAEFLRNLIYFESSAGKIKNFSDNQNEKIKSLLNDFDRNFTVRAAEIMLSIEGSLKYSLKPRILFECALVRASSIKSDLSYDGLLLRIKNLESKGLTNAISLPKNENKPVIQNAGKLWTRVIYRLSDGANPMLEKAAKQVVKAEIIEGVFCITTPNTFDADFIRQDNNLSLISSLIKKESGYNFIIKVLVKDNKTDEEDDIENLFQSTLKNKKGG